ncbi:MAG: hypothetical protein JO246_11220 [Frankiaceae bacterium]|nr:hypothetical protein [Frankiaceae bacterium]MBV9872347.1 hypothetical protein [Frankiaceae bacterium]
MRRALLAAVVVAMTLIATTSVAVAATSDDCGTLESGTCGVHGGGGQQFHGVIAVTNAPWVYDRALRSGAPGCGDCTWSMVIACPDNGDGDPTGPTQCEEALHAKKCHADQTLYRVYLNTSSLTDVAEGTVCLGGDGRVIPISQIAMGDVDRYVKNVRPPNLLISTRPRDGTLAGLLTYFRARTPGPLRSVRFGGSGVTETITIETSELNWHFGDRHSSGWSRTNRATHTYTYGGVEHGRLRTRWSATYTVSYAGRTSGPYDATGRVAQTQPFSLRVHHTRPVLVR